MKKWVILCILLWVLGNTAAIGSAAASSPAITITVSDHVVSVSGTVAEGSKYATIVVTNPNGDREYIDQIARQSDGKFQVSFTIGNKLAGTYRVTVGGDGTLTPASASFELTEPTPSPTPSPTPLLTPSPPAFPGPSVSPSPSPSPTPSAKPAFTVSAEMLSEPDQADGSVKVIIDEAVGEVLLPSAAAQLTQGRPVALIFMDGSLLIPVEVLRSMEKLAESAADGASISVRREQASSSAAAEALRKASAKYGAKLASAGYVYAYSISLRMKDAKETRMDSFEQPIVLTLPVPPGADPRLLGIYMTSSTGEFVYAGGRYDPIAGTIAAEVRGFGPYTALLVYDKSYDDVPESHWAHAAVKQLSARHVVDGISLTAYSPDADVTRAEFAVMLSRLLSLGDNQDDASLFHDVPASAWFSSGERSRTCRNHTGDGPGPVLS